MVELFKSHRSESMGKHLLAHNERIKWCLSVLNVCRYIFHTCCRQHLYSAIEREREFSFVCLFVRLLVHQRYSTEHSFRHILSLLCLSFFQNVCFTYRVCGLRSRLSWHRKARVHTRCITFHVLTNIEHFYSRRDHIRCRKRCGTVWQIHNCT